MFWKLFSIFKGVKGLDNILENHSGFILNDKDMQGFVKAYFDRPFDVTVEEPFKIFELLDNSFDDSNDKKVYEALIISSKYIKTMPDELAIEALFVIAGTYLNEDKEMENLIKLLISKVNPKLFLKYDESDIAYLIDEYFDFGIERKLLELRNLELIANVSYELELGYTNSKKYLSYFSKNLFLEELKFVCLKGNFMVDIVFEALFEHYSDDQIQVLDSLFEIMMNPTIDVKLKRGEKTLFFIQCLEEIKKRKLAHEDKDYLALKLVESKNYSRMLDWIAKIDCETNKKIIDTLIGNVTEFIILYSVSIKDVPYALNKILEHGEVNNLGIPVLDAIFLGTYDDEKLSWIIDSLYSIKPDVKFSKKTTMNLLKRGVNKFPTLINDYELTEEERMEVLESLKKVNSDWLIVYGSYLVSGDGFTKMLDYVAEEQMARIRNLKSTSTEM